MYIRTKLGQEKHDQGVVFWSEQVRLAGWSYVLFDLPGYVKPTSINGHIPDIYARHGSMEYIIEVETADSVSSQHALIQKAAFQNWTRLSSNRRFEVKVV